MKHPARTMDFDRLWDGLQLAAASGHVRTATDDTGLHLFCYTDACVYDRVWNDYTMIARGLILHPGERRVVATPFPKFFNVGERMDSIPDMPFETFEKLDGSLIIIFHHEGQWRTATKGSLNSDQSKWAAARIAESDVSRLTPGTTYLCEAIYAQNRIVVHYAYEDLVLLAAYAEDGSERSRDDLHWYEKWTGWRLAKRHKYEHVSELLEIAKTLPATEEGFVLRFLDGLRLKVKGDEYCRIHRLVSNLTPLSMWEAMMNGDDMEVIRRQLPEEFWGDFDAITRIIGSKVTAIRDGVAVLAKSVEQLSDKDVGLRLDTFPVQLRSLIFPYRKNGGDILSGRTRQHLFRMIRPTGNKLDGYRPSYSINRVLEEAA